MIDSDEMWPERARLASLAYRNVRLFEPRRQMAITAPPELVALSDQTMRKRRPGEQSEPRAEVQQLG
ncbi:hypothetical protein PUR49_05180 [Streptomyces sp. BE147]|uniref:hypothetical protein n=1 Tax=Streptomyces sp. BE147 TaxID=3002524 RepID=UPI002E792633|nr:hypothetical protein [Streptomyces sp. BE147]MEE1735908.1 hypothetical protein [Streptomyces sp. BE147]